MRDSTHRDRPCASGYVKTKIGVLPSSWEVVSLEDLSDPSAPIRYGVVQIGPHTPDGVPIVPIKHINRIDSVELHRASPEIEAGYAGSRVKGGDVLISVKGTIGAVGVVPRGFEGNIAREIARIRPILTCDANFLALQLEADDTQRRIDSKVVGSTRLEFSIHAVRDFLVALPPLTEQRAIAGLLSTWNTAIQKAEQLIAVKERLHETLSNHLLFGLKSSRRRRTSEQKSLHWFSISGEWPVVEIGQIAREVAVSRGKAEDLPVLSCTKYQGLVDSRQYFKKQVFSHDTSSYKVVRRGQFAYATNHIEEGSIGYQNLVPAGLVSPIYTVFQTDASCVDDGYLYKLLKTERLRQLFSASTNASVDRRGSLRWKEFSRIRIPLPPLDEQRRISEILNTAKRELELLRAESAALRLQKRGLMQKLLTGQWRLQTEEA